jgi:hypothetical protein
MAQTAAQKAAAAAKAKATAAKVAAAAKAKAATDAAAADAAILKDLAINHPQWSQWVTSHPELKNTIIAWAKIPGGPTQEQIDAAIFPTSLVQEYNSIQQNLDRLKALSPGEYKQRVINATNVVDNEIAKEGITISADNHQKLVDAALNNAWGNGSTELVKAVSAYVDVATQKYGSQVGPNAVSAKTSGTVSTTLNDFATIAANYGIPVPTDPAQLNEFIKQAVGPNGSEQAFTDYAKAQAIQLYPWMKGSLDAGGTVKGYLNPLGTQIANTLGINAADINWQDPKWSGLVTAYDPATKMSTPRNINDILTTIKTDPKYGYDKSMPAINNAYDLAANIKSIFGFGA